MSPRYSIIVPAFNEEVWLTKSLPAIHRAMGAVDKSGELIVVDNNSTDATALVAERHGAKVVFEPINQISRSRNAGARLARGAYLVFVDADTLITADLLKTALANLESGTCCGGGALVRFETSCPWHAQKLADFWNWISSTLGYAAGSFVYCLHDGFDAIGGFSEKVYASEEVWLSRDLRRWGRKRELLFLILTDHYVTTSARKHRQPIRNTLGLLLMVLFPPAIFFRRLCFPWYQRPEIDPAINAHRCKDDKS